MSLAARAAQANGRFGSNLKPWDLRKIYKCSRVSRQKMVSRLGGKRLMHPVLQDAKIIELRRRLEELDK